MSAILLPFKTGGAIDWAGLARQIERAAGVGLRPAVHVDRGGGQRGRDEGRGEQRASGLLEDDHQVHPAKLGREQSMGITNWDGPRKFIQRQVKNFQSRFAVACLT